MVIAIRSGKGGVRKCTVAVNLAVALADARSSVGLMNAKTYVPNIPTIVGGE
ncbi:MAG: Mrp/NBP35 family ATP-binding protein, partial [Anaerolineaceae bacterium]|nr:Mrp/NBP35 family ATP-binding protein [Anaerolineaceae bacterium]